MAVSLEEGCRQGSSPAGGISEIVLYLERIGSPCGDVALAVDDDERLHALYFSDHEDRLHAWVRAQYGETTQLLRRRPSSNAARLLAAYFAGDLTAIDSIAVATGGTPFQREVWTALRTIPAGTTRSYSALAEQIGRPKAMRAVGLANGANPISIVLPCHRVIGADRSLTGYGGGMERKRWLLAHEGVLLI